MKTDVEATRTVLIIGLSLLFMVAPPEGFAQSGAGPANVGNDATEADQSDPFPQSLEAPVGQKLNKAKVQLLETFASPNPDSAGSFGFPVAEAGDINGDGTQDFFVGAYLEDAGAQNAGRAYLVSGADGDVIRAFVSPSPDSGGAFGESLAKVDDVNGDGTPDVLAGAPEESASGVDKAGRAYLLSGTDGGVIQVFESPNPDTSGFFGNSVAQVGDVDGNDAAILIGANGEYGAPPADTVRSGRAYLYKSDGTLIQIIDSPAPTPLGAFGFEVSSTGDVNEDDTRDLVVGAFREGNGVDNAGRAYLFSGADGSLVDTLTSPNPESEGAFGASLTEVGDVNEDDVPDLLIGAPNENGGEEDAGRAYLFSGADGSPLDTLTSPNPESGGGFGISLTESGDVNEDSVPDLSIGAPNENGGEEGAGRAYLFSGEDGSPLDTLTSPNPYPGGGFGISVAGARNTEAGSPSGLLIGAYREDADSVSSGRAYLFGLQTSSLPLRITKIQPKQGAPGSNIRILGSGFDESVTVLLDSTVTATVDSAKSNVIYSQVPEGLPSGPTGVEVQRLGESVSSSQLFTVLSPERGGGPFDRIGSDITELPGLRLADAAWADYDRDGELDLAVTGEDADGNPVTRIYKNGPTDPFEDDRFVQVDAGLPDLKNGAVSWGDYNNDGHPDLAVGGTDGSSPSTLVYRNDGGGTFTEIAGPDSTGLATGDLAWGNIDGDGDLDLVASGLDQVNADGEPKTIIYENKGDSDDDGEVNFDASDTELTGLSFSSIDLGDVTGDGILDLVITGSTGGAGDFSASTKTIIYENQGAGNTDFQAAEAGLEGLQSGSAEWGDYNQDGRLDLLLTGRDGSENPRSIIYNNQGDTDEDGSPDFQSLNAGLPGVETGRGTWGDYDGDGDLDVVLAGETGDGSPTAKIYQNDGAGSFGAAGAGLDGVEGGSVTWADYDRDGDLDVLAFGNGADEAPTATLYDNGLPTAPKSPTTELRTIEEDDFPTDDSVVVGLLWNYPNELNTEKYNIYRDTEPIPRGDGPSAREPDSIESTSLIELFLDLESTPGRTYYYRVTAVDRSGRESDFSEQARFFWYPEVVSTEAERTFGQGRRKQDYRLIAVPGRSPDPEVRPRTLPQVLPDEASWRAFWDDGSASQDYIEYDESETFHLRPGRGFWVLSTETWTGGGSIWETVDLQGDSAAVVNLHDGWNIVSNPTGKNLDWNTILETNDLESKGLFSFDGTYSQEDTMASAKSGEAYYFLNDTGREELLLPYPGTPRELPESEKQKGKEQEPQPGLVLRAKQDSVGSRAKIVFDEGAEEGFGGDDVVAPTSRFSALGLRLESPASDHKPRRGYLAIERRPKIGEGQTFDLTLWSRQRGPIQISRKRIDRLSGAQVSLIVPSQDRSYELRKNKSVTLDAGQDTTQLRLAVGSPEYVKSQNKTVAPEKLRLTAYPNPVQQQATLRYALPEEMSVRIVMYDVLGRKVAQVANEKRSAGRYKATVDVSQLSSGIYFVRMRASGTTKTRKVTVVR